MKGLLASEVRLIKCLSGGIPTIGKCYFKCETKSGLSRILG
jgi:hypothetical protein